jgi:hypothetical protein
LLIERHLYAPDGIVLDAVAVLGITRLPTDHAASTLATATPTASPSTYSDSRNQTHTKRPNFALALRRRVFAYVRRTPVKNCQKLQVSATRNNRCSPDIGEHLPME